ncbi:MAG TPA: non-canonical purine NTP pyrophosphatase [Vicinamibacterales bacterium]|nr:non-canonical purine NTP pyrophosphatase [Vicinamibacterales bacterium]
MRALLLATTNPGKVREIRRVLEGVPVTLVTLADTVAVAEPEETGRTFAENARLKATYYARASGLPTVAEDSGLEIDALGGRPGVESARYNGATYPEKFANLYRELAPHPRPWTARFICALAFVGQDQALGTRRRASASETRARPHGPVPGASGVAFECSASVEGEIAPAPRGLNGFGYDPIFYYPPYGRTLGEATDAQKLAVSHRGQAFRLFRAWLEPV